MMRKTLFAVSILFGLVMLMASGQALAVPTQTAQSVMVSIVPDSTGYEITGQLKWTFDDDCGEGKYTTHDGVWDGNPPTCTGNSTKCANALNIPTAPSAPEIDTTGPNSVKNHINDCAFFDGGDLGGWSYTKTKTVDGLIFSGTNYTFTYTYTVDGPGTVAERTCWDSEYKGDDPFVDVGFSGFISSESFMKQTQGNSKMKYSFTADNRVRNVVAQLQVSDGSGGWGDVGDPIPFGVDDGSGTYILAVTPTIADYLYCGNAGVFGNGAVYSYLHYPCPGNAAYVSAILLGPPDDFAGNNNDLATGNVHQANFEDMFLGLGAGDYRILVTGTIKGNSGISDFDFGVTSNLIEVGKCVNGP